MRGQGDLPSHQPHDRPTADQAIGWRVVIGRGVRMHAGSPHYRPDLERCDVLDQYVAIVLAGKGQRQRGSDQRPQRVQVLVRRRVRPDGSRAGELDGGKLRFVRLIRQDLGGGRRLTRPRDRRHSRFDLRRRRTLPNVDQVRADDGGHAVRPIL